MRFHALDQQSLWDDEMSSLRTITTPAGELSYRFSTHETHPPLYFLQLKVWSALRMRSLVKLRANSALWGMLSLALVFLVARLYGGDTVGLLALAFLVLSPLQLAYSQELRPYAMAMTLGLSALLALERRKWILLGCLWTALLYTHYWGAFVVLAQGIYGYTTDLAQSQKKAVLAAAGSASVLFLPWLPILYAQLGVIDRMAFWVPAFSLMNLAKVFAGYSGLFFNMASWTFYLPTTVWVLALFGLCFAAALGLGLSRGPKGPVLWLLIGVGVPWLLSLWKTGIFLWYRYPVLMFPAFAILLATGLQAVKPRPVRVIMVLAVLGSQAWGSWVYFHGWQKANPKAVMQYVHWLKQPDSVIIRPSYFADLYSFYDLGTTSPIDENLLDTSEKRTTLKGKHIIFIAFDVPYDPVGEALVREFKTLTVRYFPGTAHLGIAVYQLK